ncbi:hypothetical protein GCM10018963_10790 [Saccharothrix longispora]
MDSEYSNRLDRTVTTFTTVRHTGGTYPWYVRLNGHTAGMWKTRGMTPVTTTREA